MFHKAIFSTKNSADCFVNQCFSSGFTDVTVIKSLFVNRVSVLVYWQEVSELQSLIDIQRGLDLI